MQSTKQTSLQFTPKKALKVFLVVVWLFCVSVIILAYIFLVYQDEQLQFDYWVAGIGFLTLLFSIFVFNFLTIKLKVENQKMTFSSFLKTRSLLITDIKGVRKNGIPNSINAYDAGKPVFIPKKSSLGKKISTFHNKELVSWARINFVDLDIADYEEGLTEIHTDTTFGTTETERKSKLRAAKRFHRGIGSAGGILLGISIFFGLPRIIGLVYCAIAAVLSVFGLIYYKGLIRMESKPARVSLWIPIILIAALATFIMMELGSTVFLPLLKEGLVLSCVFNIIYLFSTTRKKGLTLSNTLKPLVLFFLLTYASIRVFNVLADTSKPQTYTTEILEIRRETSSSRYGSSISYDMFLQPWNTRGISSHQIPVSKESFETIAAGTIVEIKEYQGAFGAKWFTVHLGGKELNHHKSYLF